MRAFHSLLVGALLLASGAIADKPTAPLLLNASNFDPVLLPPPPPGDASVVGHAELEQLRVIERTRTADEIAHAKSDGATKNATIFAAAIGPAFDLDRLPATKALFQIVRAEEKAAADRAKAHFLRNRPWIVDPKIGACGKEDDLPQSSYPSGHATMSYSMAAILARLVPSKAPAILARAADYAHSRLVCEVHFPSDVVAGQAYGMLVAERLMEQPEFRASFESAAKELQAAGIR